MTWTAPEVERPERPVGDEQTSLAGMLEHQRLTLRSKCGGLTAEQLCRQPIPGSTLSLLGIVRHLIDAEAVWWRERFAGEEIEFLYFTEEFPEADFEDLVPERAEADFAAYDAELARIRETLANRTLDEEFTRASGQTVNVRWLYLHMIAEYARHNGHADLIREQIDGRTGD